MYGSHSRLDIHALVQKRYFVWLSFGRVRPADNAQMQNGCGVWEQQHGRRVDTSQFRAGCGLCMHAGVHAGVYVCISVSVFACMRVCDGIPMRVRVCACE